MELPAPSDDPVSTSRVGIFERQVAWVEKMDRILRFFCFPFYRRGRLRHMYAVKLTHGYANLVLRHCCKEISTYRYATQLVESGAIAAIFQAIKNGTSMIVIEILKANPDLIWCNETLSREIMISAIKYRQAAILKFVYKLDAGKKALLSLRDKDGNNALHLVAKLPDPTLDYVDNHKAWTFIREGQWFEEIKEYLPCWYHEAKNHYGETPEQVFYKEHRELIKEIEEWGKKTAKSYILASVLIVTIMFAALFTVPGGNDEKTGMPTLLHRKPFTKFLICDTVSFLAASTSLMGFLSILTFSYDGFVLRRVLPLQMLVSIFALIISIATMILAFIFALTMMLGNKWQGPLAIIVYLISVTLLDGQLPTLLTFLYMMVFNKKIF